MNGHMRIGTFLCLCGWLAVAGAAQAVGVGAAAGAGGAGLDKDFEMLFGPEAAKVAATPDGRDDAAFAEKVLAVARTADKTPPLQAMLCEKAYEYGMRHAAGCATAAAALRNRSAIGHFPLPRL